jgi:hypothetical protein
MHPMDLLDFISEIPVYIIFIFLCLVLSLVSLAKKNPPAYLALFTCYLLLTLVIECVGWSYKKANSNNLTMYNLYGVVHLTYAIYLLSSFLQPGRAKQVFTWIMLFYPAFALLNIYFIQGPRHFGTYSYIVGAVIVVVCSINYFYQRIKFPGRDNLLRDPSFWIATGLLFFNAITVPYLGIVNFLANIPQYAYKTFSNINAVLSIILYSLFCISSVCSLNFRKLPS